MIKTDNDELRLDTHQLIMQSKWNKQVIKLKCLKFRQKKAKKKNRFHQWSMLQVQQVHCLSSR